MQQVILDNDLFDEREEQIQGLKNDMIEVSGLFKQVQKLIEDQADDVDTIATHVTNSSDYTNKGLKSVKKAEEEADKSTMWIIGGLGVGVTAAIGAVVAAVFLL